MKIICAPDSFKGSITANDAASAMAAGVVRAVAASAAEECEIDRCPVADGGEGTRMTLVDALDGASFDLTVIGPLGEPMTARWSLGDDGATGLVDLADASGLVLVPPDRRDPTFTTTFGTGQLIVAAGRAARERVFVGIGGSATCDGGAGIAQALGARFFDRAGRLITEPITGGQLSELSRVERASDAPPIVVACDVTNPLCGAEGSAAVYGPQKGAGPAEVALLDWGLAHLAELVRADPEVPGYGAAGGAGFGLVELCGATLRRGIDLVLETVRFDERCADADLVLTGEGRLDGQSMYGKASIGVALAARRQGVPTIAIVGDTGPGFEKCLRDGARGGPLAGYAALAERFGVERALSETARLIEETTAAVVGEW